MTFFKKLKALMSCAHGSCETRAQMPDVMNDKFLDTIIFCFFEKNLFVVMKWLKNLLKRSMSYVQLWCIKL